MTSNLGSDEFNEKAAQIGFHISENEENKIIADFNDIRDRVLKQLPDFFSPEFLNRIDKTIVFQPIDKTLLKQIITLQLDELITRLTPIGIALEYDKKAIHAIADETYTPEYGARPVRRFIQDKIEDIIAEKMISSTRKKSVMLSAEKGELTFNWK